MPRSARQNFTKSARRIADEWLRSRVAKGKYDHIDFKPPASVAEAAEKGLEYRRKQKGDKAGLSTEEAAAQGIGSGVQRAVNLKNRDTLSPATVRRMHNFFNRHQKNKAVGDEHRGEPWKDKGYVAWLLWGGDPGRSWAAKLVRQMDAADERKKESSHSRSCCMERGCKKPPEVECVWAEGRAHAWFCQKHFDSWSKEDTGEGLPKAIVKQRKVPGVVGDRYGEHLGKTAKATGSKTGNGESVGLFIPLPKNLAKKFPSLGKEDSSPSHVTFLYIGDFEGEEQQRKLVEVLDDCCRRWWPMCEARLLDLDYFDHHDKDRRVPHVSVDFDKDLSGFKHRVKQELQDAGIEVGDKFPEYKPHVTLAYLPGMDSEWDGPVPKGSWKFDEMEVWGLPQVHRLKLGPQPRKVAASWARGKVAAWWAIRDSESYGIGSARPPVDKGTLMNAVPGTDPGSGALYMGDGPADVLGPALDEVDLEYLTTWGRPATEEELDAAWNFVMGPRRDGKPVNPWFSGLCRWLGVAPKKVRLGLDVLMALRPFFGGITGKPRHLDQIEEYRQDIRFLNDPQPEVSYEALDMLEKGMTEKLRRLWTDLMSRRVSSAWISRRVASVAVQSSHHRKNVALMKWLSQLTRRLGVGRDTYVVGGAVRNFLIDKPIKDIDIVIDTTKARRDSDWLAKQISKHIPAPTNVTTNQYGVAILTVKGDWMVGGENLRGEVLEIANARKESYGGAGGKGYKPHSVAPATIEEDVLRREFRFNTLLWRLMDLAKGPEKAEVIDLTGCGRADLQRRVLRCPQDPDKVFSDDPTRMLRAVKFTGKYGFKIPPDVVRSIRKNAPKLKRMPWEAVASILVNDVLNQPTARRSLKQMKDLGLLGVVSEMVQDHKPFATYMANQLRRNRKVQLLLDLMDLGVPASTPISFLDPSGRKRLRDLTVSMPEKEAVAFVEKLIKPPVDNRRIIEVLDLPGPERRHIVPTARHLILQDPDLAEKGQHLTDAVIKELRR